MASCQCSNIEIMQLFHELKQKFPVVPDHIVTQCIHQNAHNRDLCENELAAENSHYLRHCFPQGLVDQMNPPSSPPQQPPLVAADESQQVYFERGYSRRSLDNARCSRRKSSTTSEEAGSVTSAVNASANKISSKMSKKLGLGLPPKHAKKLYRLSGGKYGTGPSEAQHAAASGVAASDGSGEKRRHSSHSKSYAADIRVDHRGIPERYKKFDEIVAKGKYKKLTSELGDITNKTARPDTNLSQQSSAGNLGDVTMSEADQQMLYVAQQMLGLKDNESENRKSTQQLSPRRVRQQNRKVSPVSRHGRGHSSHNSDVSISADSPATDHDISSNTRWNYHRSVSTPHPPLASSNISTSDNRPADRGSLKLDLFSQQPVRSPIDGASRTFPGSGEIPSNQVLPGNQMFNQALSGNQMFPNNPTGNQTFPTNQTSPDNQRSPSQQSSLPSNQFHLSVPSSSGPDVTSVSVLSYSAPTTPLSASSPLFPPLAVDVNTGGHRTSLSLEPLPYYGLSEDPARPLTKVTLSLRPPGSQDDDPALMPRPNTGGFTYTSYSLKDGVQAQLHISIGSNVSPTTPTCQFPTTTTSQPTTTTTATVHPLESSNQSAESHLIPQQIPAATRNVLNAQIERKAKLFNALMCERERLNAIKRDISAIEEKIKEQRSKPKSSKKAPRVPSPRVSKLQLEVRALQEECARMSKVLKSSPASPPELNAVPANDPNEFYSHIYTGQQIASLCQANRTAQDQPIHRNLHIEVTHDTFPTRGIVHSWVV